MSFCCFVSIGICVGERYIYKGIVSSGKLKKNPIHNGLRVPCYFSHTHIYILYCISMHVTSLPVGSVECILGPKWYIWA